MTQTNGHDPHDDSHGGGHNDQGHGGDIIPESSVQDWLLKAITLAALAVMVFAGWQWLESGKDLAIQEEHTTSAGHSE